MVILDLVRRDKSGPNIYCSEVGEYTVMGCPKCIDDKKYERNAFIFNFVFVFSSSTDTSAYVPVIQKMGNAFRTYEVLNLASYPGRVWHNLASCPGEAIT